MKLNTKAKTNIRTHEGAPAQQLTPVQQLRRSIMSCLLWEKEFYEDGDAIVKRIAGLVPRVPPPIVAQMAIEARTKMHLRHVPLLLVREMARHDKHKGWVVSALPQVIQRVDEMAEFLAVYFATNDGSDVLANSAKKGLAATFANFSEYDFAKYQGTGRIKLRDVINIAHPVPANKERSAIYEKITSSTLGPAGTWENALSDEKDKRSKREKWESLLQERKMGALAILRNLRNFQNEGVDEDIVLDALSRTDVSRVLPFRFIAAARFAPQWEAELEKKMFESITGKLPGKTIFLIDVSGSMGASISEKSDMTRMDAACGVAMIGREMAEKATIYTFSNEAKKVPSRRGFALRDAIINSQYHGGTRLGGAVAAVDSSETYDRLIIVTDEQSHDYVPSPKGKGYMINVASAENGVRYDAYTHVDGWSEAVLRYIVELES
jgi:60 kDa SS-A/Ro ribonucleoprotein